MAQIWSSLSPCSNGKRPGVIRGAATGPNFKSEPFERKEHIEREVAVREQLVRAELVDKRKDCRKQCSSDSRRPERLVCPNEEPSPEDQVQAHIPGGELDSVAVRPSYQWLVQQDQLCAGGAEKLERDQRHEPDAIDLYYKKQPNERSQAKEAGTCPTLPSA